ncbi:hypothetical protein, partial [Pseudonocardia sp. NPDC049154]|uniref:hypothetical protein n=1 Tax=Pseudonocardia sp. NPDC049154 TaxID=3155501 RepID=UPI0034072A0E
RAFGLDAERTRHGLAGALLAGRGSLHSVGSGGEDWRLHNPGAARDGYLYAAAARAGMTAGPGALDARHGFLAMVAGLDEVPATLRTPPRADLVLGVWTKALPTLGDNMAAALVARELHGADTDGPVTVRMNADFAAFPGTQTRPPYPTLTSALSSVRFVVAHLLLTGGLTVDDYARRADPRVCALAERIEVQPDPTLGHRDAEIVLGAGPGAVRRRAADLPRTVWFPDAPTQRAHALALLGDAGPEVVDALLTSGDGEPAAAVLEAALGRGRAS